MAKVTDHICLDCEERVASRVCAVCGQPLCQKCSETQDGICLPCVLEGSFFVQGELQDE